MMFSIVVPHYNDLVGLKRLFQSLPQRNDIEVIVIDDNSVIQLNKFSELATEFQYLNIKFYANTKGIKGAGACRNIGLDKVKGEYILFADADDYFLPDAFNILDNVLSNAPNNDIYYFKPTSQCLITGKLSDRHVVYVDLIDRYLKHGDNAINARFRVPWSKVYFARFVKESHCKFDEVLASNDVMFSLKTGFLAKKIHVLEDAIYCVTRGKGTLTVNRTKENQQSRLMVAIRESEFINRNNIQIEKASVVGLIRGYFPYLEINLTTLIFKNYIKGNLIFFPRSYWGYIKNPKLIIKRIKDKNKLSIHDDKYI